MAEETRLVPFLTAPVKAGADLRSHQYKLVWYGGTSCILSIADAGSGTSYVLMNAPNSGQAVTLNTKPNITKAVAGTAMVVGDLVVAGASATCIATSASFLTYSTGAGAVTFMGVAETACSSGNTFNLRLV